VDPISIQEAAQRYRISEATIRRMVRNGELTRYTRRGDRRAFVDREALEKLLEYKPDAQPPHDRDEP
jgi:excisionase family DNA binding protein